MPLVISKRNFQRAMAKIALLLPAAPSDQFGLVGVHTKKGAAGPCDLILAVDVGDACFHTTISCESFDEVLNEERPFSIMGRTLFDISRSCKSDLVELNYNSEEGLLVIECGLAKWSLPVFTRVIPLVEASPPEASFNANELIYAIEQVRYSVGFDSGRPYLMMLDFRQGKARACDGVKYHETTVSFSDELSLISSAIELFLRVLKNSWIGNTVGLADDGKYKFSCGGDVLSIAKPRSSFPDMDSILVKPLKSQVPALLKVNKRDLLTGLRDVRILADKVNRNVELTINQDKILLRCSGKNGAEATTEIPARWTTGERVAIFNVDDLLKFIDSAEDESLELRFGKDTSSGKSPVVMQGGDSWSLLNQMRPLK